MQRNLIQAIVIRITLSLLAGGQRLTLSANY